MLSFPSIHAKRAIPANARLTHVVKRRRKSTDRIKRIDFDKIATTFAVYLEADITWSEVENLIQKAENVVLCHCVDPPDNSSAMPTSSTREEESWSSAIQEIELLLSLIRSLEGKINREDVIRPVGKQYVQDLIGGILRSKNISLIARVEVAKELGELARGRHLFTSSLLLKGES